MSAAELAAAIAEIDNAVTNQDANDDKKREDEIKR